MCSTSIESTESTESQSVREDSSLINLARAGDADAYCELMRALGDRLYRQAWLFCRDSSAAEDLVQDTLVAAWKSFSRFDGRCELFTWLYAIMLRKWKKRLRTSLRKPLVFLGLVNERSGASELGGWGSVEMGASVRISNSESVERLDRWVERLPPKMKTVIRMRYFAELSVREISLVTDVPEGTVKSRLSYALERLRAMREQEEKK